MTAPTNVPGRMLTDHLYTTACQLKIPLSGTFELSPVCNFNCRMCYVRKSPKEVAQSPRKILSLDQWRRIAAEARDAGMLYLLITGGEPFLWPDFLSFYDELIDMGFIISINTNGSLIDANAIQHLRKKPPQRINITLYGANNATYKRLCGVDNVFTQVDNAIRGLQEAGITVKLNCSLTPENAADLDWIIDYAKERNIVLAVTTYMFPPVRRDPSLVGVNERFTPEESAYYSLRSMLRQQGEERYRKQLKRIADGCIDPPGLDESCIDPVDGRVRCRAGSASFWITWDGWVTPCGMMPEPKVDVHSGSFAEVWDRLTEKTAALKVSGTCTTCPNRKVCHACAAMATAETGTASGIPTYLCRTAQHMQKIARETLSRDEIEPRYPMAEQESK